MGFKLMENTYMNCNEELSFNKLLLKICCQAPHYLWFTLFFIIYLGVIVLEPVRTEPTIHIRLNTLSTMYISSTLTGFQVLNEDFG